MSAIDRLKQHRVGSELPIKRRRKPRKVHCNVCWRRITVYAARESSRMDPKFGTYAQECGPRATSQFAELKSIRKLRIVIA